MAQETDGARLRAGVVAPEGGHGSDGGRQAGAAAPISSLAFAGFAIASFGGPLALAALNAPSLVAGASDSAGLAMVLAVVVFAAPLWIWLRYSKHLSSGGGLTAFVESAAGRRVALAQAAVWIVSYVLYLVYTPVQIVYDVLPAVLPGERGYQTLLALLIPVAVAGVMIAGRTVTLVVVGAMAVGQLVLVGILDAVTLAHISTPASSFRAGAPGGALAKASAQTSLLYICGSLPLFLGGELARPGRTIRRGLTGAYVLTAAVVTLAVAPLAAAPGLLHTDIPGVSVAQQFASPGVADAIGIGVGVSIAGLILCEYVAITRLVNAVGGWRIRPVTIAIAVVVVLAGPLSLIDPDGFYNTLIKPSLVALWLSQLVVFVVYPRFAVRRGQRPLTAWTVGLIASGFALYGVWTALQTVSS